MSRDRQPRSAHGVLVIGGYGFFGARICGTLAQIEKSKQSESIRPSQG